MQRMAHATRIAIPASVLITSLSPLSSHAQSTSDQTVYQDLIEKLERLSNIVDKQAVQIEQQAKKIEALESQKQAAGSARSPSIVGVAKDNDVGPVSEPLLDQVIADTMQQDAAQDVDPGKAIQTVPTEKSIDEFRIGRFPDTAIVRPGDFEGSITIPGVDGSFRIGGFVRAQLDYDFDSIGTQGNAVPYTIPLDGSLEDGTEQLGFTIRDTQINFDYRRNSELGLLRAFVEFDFFGEGDEFNNDYGVRIRHAAIGIGRFQFGQFWSLFTHLDSIPEVVELLGPHGAPVFRTPGIRWYDKIGDHWNWAIGLEDPAGDLSGDASQFASESVPNVLGYIERTGDWGEVRLSGIGLELRSSTDKKFTGGGSLTGRINVPFLHNRDVFLFGGQVGAGFAKQYAGFGGVGLEGIVDDQGNIDATEILAGYIAYQHWWKTRWRSTAYASIFDFDQGILADPSSLSYSFKAGGNVFWSPVTKLNLGAEVIYITREDVSGDEGSGVRVQFVGQINF